MSINTGKTPSGSLLLAIVTEKAYVVMTIVACGDDQFFVEEIIIPGG